MLTVHADTSARHFTVYVNTGLILSHFLVVDTLVRVSVALTRCNDDRYYYNHYYNHYYNYYYNYNNNNFLMLDWFYGTCSLQTFICLE